MSKSLTVGPSESDHSPISAYGHWRQMGAISTICPLDCDFCYRKGTPSGLIIDSRPRNKTVGDIHRTQMAIKRGIALDPLDDTGEFMCNPQFLPILEVFRKYYPLELVDFTTSGINLTIDTIKSFARLQPIFLQVSLNSANPAVRRKVMGDPRPTVAIEGVRLLQQFGIPFSATIVGWPTIPDDDILRTIEYLDSCQPVVIKVNLPGYSRFFPGPVAFDTAERWSALVDIVCTARKTVSTPVTWEPFMPLGDPLAPVISGVVRNSPAHRQGLLPNDLVREVNGTPIMFREQARSLLIQRDNEQTMVRLIVERQGERKAIEISDDNPLSKDEYPHRPAGHPREAKMFGIVMHQGIDLTGFEALGKIAEKHRARHLLFTSSQALGVTTRHLVEHIGARYFPSTDVSVIAPINVFFGGNIMIGDLLTVSDYSTAIKAYIEKNKAPDLVVLPSSAFVHGVDLIGVEWHRIEQVVGVPVALLPVRRIMF